MPDPRYHVIIIGGGVVGLAVAVEITRRNPRQKPLVLEKEDAMTSQKDELF
jgi:L-2-hydroxyglutarate oxidase LhgO